MSDRKVYFEEKIKYNVLPLYSMPLIEQLLKNENDKTNDEIEELVKFYEGYLKSYLNEVNIFQSHPDSYWGYYDGELCWDIEEDLERFDFFTEEQWMECFGVKNDTEFPHWKNQQILKKFGSFEKCNEVMKEKYYICKSKHIELWFKYYGRKFNT